MLSDAEFGGGLLDNASNLRVRMRGAVAGFVAVPALAVLLAEPSRLDDAIGAGVFDEVRLVHG
jgi:hypothetical protein